jgi:16S rRNA (guanine527-N7)-methyltransferase
MLDILKTDSEKMGLHLSPRQLKQFEIYYRELIDWNRKMNLTRITDYEEVQIKHFLDSLTVTQALKLPLSKKDFRVIDVGTGAGLPGIPLRIILDINLVLLEATAKKVTFLKHLITVLGLEDIEVVSGRAEEVAHDPRYREVFDLVLSRAVAPLPALVELALPFCTLGGLFIAPKKGDIEQELGQASKVIALMGGKLCEVKEITSELLPDSRYLVVIEKVSPTPLKYPRRPGMPEKNPIIS